MLSIALVGRPNVGKSTLFNRLARKKLAIVDDTPGVTRDWREAEGYLFDQKIRIIDTAGLEDTFDDSIEGRMRKQTEEGLKRADVILFMIDGRAGVMPLDEYFARYLRKTKKPVYLVVNKVESEKSLRTELAEAYKLGLGEPIAISSEHGNGMEDLYQTLMPHFPEEAEDGEGEEEEEGIFQNLDDLEGNEDFEFEQEEIAPETPIKLAIVGRPNVGKSTLLNAIVKEHRSMTGPEAGITRDAVTVDWEFADRKFKLVDTAGMRRKSKVQDNIERQSVDDALRAIRLAQVVCMVMDANEAMDKQDLQIANHIIEEGRALVLVVNKWDTIEDKEDALEDFKWEMENSLAQVKNIPFVTISALNNKGVQAVLKTALKTFEVWNARVSTGKLNKWLARIESQNPAPLVSGRQNRLKYITQIKSRPPTFVLWTSRPDKLPDSYKRYITNSLARDYNIQGVPIRLMLRRSKNPYA